MYMGESWTIWEISKMDNIVFQHSRLSSTKCDLPFHNSEPNNATYYPSRVVVGNTSRVVVRNTSRVAVLITVRLQTDKLQ